MPRFTMDVPSETAKSFCKAHNYTEMIEDSLGQSISNPESYEACFRRIIKEIVIGSAQAYEVKTATVTARQEAIDSVDEGIEMS